MSNKNKLKHQAKEDILKNQEGDVDTQATVDNEANADVSEEQKETEEVEDTSETKENPLQKAQAELDELKDKYLRTVAEFENYKKRTQKEKAELIFNGSEKTVSAILPILDDMERAAANSANTEDIQALEEGWELIFKKLQTTLEGLGVKKIETKDKDFDVDFHEAVAMVPGVEEDKKGKVVDCVQTGYTLNEKVIRHAKVAVGQ